MVDNWKQAGLWAVFLYINKIKICRNVMHKTIIIFILLTLTYSVYADTKPISNVDLVSRLIRLETKVDLRFSEMDKALILARQSIDRDKEIATQSLNLRLEGMNEFRRQMDKQEATYAKKDTIDNRFSALERLVYTGVGIILVIQFLGSVYFFHIKKGK